MCQDALTDLTGDSERLPVEEQHGTWLGHKVRAYGFKPARLQYRQCALRFSLLRFSVLHSAVSTSNIAPNSKGHFSCE